jgi:hypothetical protein
MAELPDKGLSDKVARVRLLLETLDDPYPSSQGALRSDSGPAASRYVPCETCRSNGWLKTRQGLTLCMICNGYGWRRRERADIEWDAYVGLPVAEAVTLPTMGVTPGRQEPDTREETFVWERARKAHDRHGSYKEVRLRLDDLSRAHRPRYRLVRYVLIEKEPRRMSARDDMEMTLGVVWIALRMRSVRVPPWIMERSAAAEKRDTLAALVADGYSAGEIAKRTGMTKDAVRRRMRRGGVHSREAGIPARAI